MLIKIRFNTSHAFCQASYLVTYDGYQIEINSGGLNDLHSLFIETTAEKYELVYESAFGFLSELSWLFQTKVEIKNVESLQKKPVGLFGVYFTEEYHRTPKGIDLEGYKQIASNNKQKLALGIYREGISSNSYFYGFLSYARIINIQYTLGPEQKNWINNHISKIRDNKNVLNELKNEEAVDIGEYLYNSGRCAIAHANLEKPVANPNTYKDNVRISRDLPLIKELAEIFIREELNIPNRF